MALNTVQFWYYEYYDVKISFVKIYCYATVYNIAVCMLITNLGVFGLV